MRLRPVAAVLFAASLLLVGCGSSGSSAKSSATTNPTTPPNTDPALNNTVLRATLSGANEVPGPGSPAGAGTAMIRFEPIDQMVCWDIEVAQIDTPTAAHIHSGATGVAGDIQVTMTPPVNGSSMGCAVIAVPLLQQIVATPAAYYVNVHTTAYPNGALRGQLSK